MTYTKKNPEDFGPGDRVRINIEPGCPGAPMYHGFMHSLVNTITGRIAWISDPPPKDCPDHVWRVNYDGGYYGWHKPSELVDYIYEVLVEGQAAQKLRQGGSGPS